MSVPTYHQRRANIHTVNDLEDELRKANLYVRRMRRNAKNAKLLESKIKIQQSVKEAESVLRKLRCNYFDIEDELTVTKS